MQCSRHYVWLEGFTWLGNSPNSPLGRIRCELLQKPSAERSHQASKQQGIPWPISISGTLNSDNDLEKQIGTQQLKIIQNALTPLTFSARRACWMTIRISVPVFCTRLPQRKLKEERWRNQIPVETTSQGWSSEAFGHLHLLGGIPRCVASLAHLLGLKLCNHKVVSRLMSCWWLWYRSKELTRVRNEYTELKGSSQGSLLVI